MLLAAVALLGILPEVALLTAQESPTATPIEPAPPRVEWWQPDGRLGSAPRVFDVRDADDEASAMTVAFSPDGEHLAAALSSGELRLWNLKLDFRERSVLFGSAWSCSDVAFGPQATWGPGGQWLAVAADEVVFVEAATGEILDTLERSEADSLVVSVDVSQDGRLLACAGGGFVELWDIAGLREIELLQRFDTGVLEGEMRVRFEGNDSYVYAWPFTDEFGMHALEDEVEHALRLWDVESGEEVLALSADRYPVRAAIATDLFDAEDEGFPMALGMQGGAVRLVEVRHESLEGVLTGHGAPVTALAVTWNDDRLASGNEQGRVDIWDLTTDRRRRKPLATFDAGESLVSALAWDRDGGRLAAACHDGTVHLFTVTAPARSPVRTASGADAEPAPGRPLVVPDVRGGALSVDGETLFTLGVTGSQLRDAHDLRPLPMPAFPDPFRGRGAPSAGVPCLSADGSRLALVLRNAVDAELFGLQDPTVPVLLDWNVADGALVGSQTRQAANLSALCWSPTQPLVVGGTSGGLLLIWDRSGDEATRIVGVELDSGAVTALAFDAAGERLVSVHDSGLARVWDAASWELLATLDHDGDALRALAISSDATRLVTGGDGGVLRFWDLAAGQPIGDGVALDQSRSQAQSLPQPVTALAFDPRGTRVLAGLAESGPVIVDAEDLLVLAGLRGPRPYLGTHQLAWTADDRVFIWVDVLDDDRLVHVLQLWDASP